VNLTEKNKIEKQAIGRAVRLGQKKNVQVLRFIMKNTIEQIYLNKII
jgi:SNF2 family DNA or RNA helicase